MRRREETESVPSPAPKVITIVEMITVKELGEQAGTSTGEIIKVLTGMGITATANQYLSPELATRVALEFGCAIEVTPFEEVQESAAEVGDPISLAPPEPTVPGTTPDGKPPPVEEHLPVSKVVKIPEMVTVKDLSERVSTGPGEIIKVLMKMGITATVNQDLSPELAARVALEFGYTVEVTPFEEVKRQSRTAEVGLPDVPWPDPSTATRARRTDGSETGQSSDGSDALPVSYSLKSKLSLLGSVIVTMALVVFVLTYEQGFLWSRTTRPAVEKGERPTPIPVSSTTKDTRTYRDDIKPIIGAYCAKCHGPNGVAARIPLETYEDVSRYVKPGHSRESRLYTFIQERKNHVNPWPRSWGDAPNDKLLIIKDWIDANNALE